MNATRISERDQRLLDDSLRMSDPIELEVALHEAEAEVRRLEHLLAMHGFWPERPISERLEARQVERERRGE